MPNFRMTLNGGSPTSLAGMGLASSTMQTGPVLPDVELFTDTSDKGFGCYFQGKWCQGTFSHQRFGDQQMSINWHELYAATMALALWGPS